jgi:hypothetical protein
MPRLRNIAAARRMSNWLWEINEEWTKKWLLCQGTNSMTQTSACLTETKKTRRSGRLTVELPILIIGTEPEGRVFSEETKTVVLSLHGAGIISSHKLMAEQDLVLRIVGSNREAEVRVVGEIGQQGKMHTYGVRFVDERLDFWKMDFPAPHAMDDHPRLLALECSACKRVVELHGGDFEYDICVVHGAMARYCDHCGFLTVWREPTSPWRVRLATMVEPEQTASSPKVLELTVDTNAFVEEFLPLAAAISPQERRKRIRAKVNFVACVKAEKCADEVVTCIDMSKGGVSFRSRTPFPKETTVQIAVPFSPDTEEDQVIFVPGRVTNVNELVSMGMWRCGVEFLRG